MTELDHSNHEINRKECNSQSLNHSRFAIIIDNNLAP